MPSTTKIDRTKIAAEISVRIHEDNEVEDRTKMFALQVAAYWANVAWPFSPGTADKPNRHGMGRHPYETGDYRDSIHIRQNRAPKTGRFVAGWTAYSDSPIANFIEFGTDVDKRMGSPWGPNTPTPEFAPAARTAHHFGGTAP